MALTPLLETPVAQHHVVPHGTGSRQAFHWPFASLQRALSVRFLPNSIEADPEEWLWSGDLKLDTIGEVAVKLRMPWSEHDSAARSGSSVAKEYIARVKLALVGASVTVVFERQVKDSVRSLLEIGCQRRGWFHFSSDKSLYLFYEYPYLNPLSLIFL